MKQEPSEHRETTRIENSESAYRKGVFAAALSYFIWGLVPIYWKAIDVIPSMELIFVRIALSWGFVGILAIFFCEKEEMIAPWKDKKLLLNFTICGILVSVNWGLFIYSVVSGNILESSMGYYINPLLSALFGVIFFKEKLAWNKILSFSIVGIGILFALLTYGHIPYIALSLSITFASYGALKKKLNANTIVSLFYETLFLTPVALIVVVYIETHWANSALKVASVSQLILLVFVGVVTAVPLMLFAYGANRIHLSTMGVVQYISPTMTFLLGVFFYGEELQLYKVVLFICIWIAVVIFTVPMFFKNKSSV